MKKVDADVIQMCDLSHINLIAFFISYEKWMQRCIEALDVFQSRRE